MKNSLVQLAIAVIAVNAASQIPALAADDQKPQVLYVLASPTRPNCEMLGPLPLPGTVVESMAPSIVASQPESSNSLRNPSRVTTAKGW